jgi:hypothetical protein
VREARRWTISVGLTGKIGETSRAATFVISAN